MGVARRGRSWKRRVLTANTLVKVNKRPGWWLIHRLGCRRGGRGWFLGRWRGVKIVTGSDGCHDETVEDEMSVSNSN
jgi:hypothetical protein